MKLENDKELIIYSINENNAILSHFTKNARYKIFMDRISKIIYKYINCKPVTFL